MFFSNIFRSYSAAFSCGPIKRFHHIWEKSSIPVIDILSIRKNLPSMDGCNHLWKDTSAILVRWWSCPVLSDPSLEFKLFAAINICWDITKSYIIKPFWILVWIVCSVYKFMSCLRLFWSVIICEEAIFFEGLSKCIRIIYGTITQIQINTKWSSTFFKSFQKLIFVLFFFV